MKSLIKKKKTVSLLIILLGLGLSFLINKGSFGQGKTPLSGGIYTKSSESPNLNFKIDSNPAASNGNRHPAEGNQQNLTDAIARSYLAKIFESNPSGVGGAGNQSQLALPSELSFEEVLQDYLQGSFVWSRFEIKDVKVSQDNSQKSRLAYLEAVRRVMDARKQSIDREFNAFIEFLETSEARNFENHISSIEGQINNLLGLSVPSEIKFFHLQLLNNWGHQLAVYKAVRNIKDDPAGALLAISEIEKIAGELSAINAAVEGEYETLKS